MTCVIAEFPRLACGVVHRQRCYLSVNWAVRVGRHLEPALAVLAASVDDANIDLACAPTQCGRRFTGDRFHYRAYSFFTSSER